jgi:aerobic carbon-monoxide dehydrogenase large subunit
VRLRNMVRADEMPYRVGIPYRDGEPIVYDGGDYPGALQKALAAIGGLAAFRERQRAAREQGRYLGLGLGCYVEGTGVGPFESATVRIDPSGKIFVSSGACPQGQGMETIFAQVVADAWRVAPDDVTLSLADTAGIATGFGTIASRTTVTLSAAIHGASERLRAKVFAIAANMLECAPVDLELRDGKVGVKGAPGLEKTIAEIAMHAHFFRLSMPDDPTLTSGMDAAYTYDHPLTTLPSDDRSDLGIFYPIMGHMCHMPVVEVDVGTGQVRFLDYVAVHDCGTLVNPMTLAGHVRGGTAQGIGTALYEQYYYDADGQLLTANYADYLMPSVHELPENVRVGHVETPSPYTEYGIKGGGEGGRMGAPPAICSAIEDALRPLGVKVDALPITPRRLRTLIREAQPAAA